MVTSTQLVVGLVLTGNTTDNGVEKVKSSLIPVGKGCHFKNDYDILRTDAKHKTGNKLQQLAPCSTLNISDISPSSNTAFLDTMCPQITVKVVVQGKV